MKTVKTLIQELNITRDTNEFKALSLIDEYLTSLDDRTSKLEARNLRYYCRAYSDRDQAILTGVVTPVALNSTEYPQFGNMHDNATENTKIFIRRNGVYYIGGLIEWESVGGGTYRESVIRLTGSRGALNIAEVRSGTTVTATYTTHNLFTAYYCYEGDYVELCVEHDRAGGVDILTDYPHGSHLVVSERREDLYPSQYGLLNPEQNMR